MNVFLLCVCVGEILYQELAHVNQCDCRVHLPLFVQVTSALISQYRPYLLRND